MTSLQSNTQQGLIVLAAGEALTGKEGYLVKAANSSGTNKPLLPTANSDLCVFVVEEGAASGSNVTLRPLELDRQVRLIAKGSITPGQVLVLADVGTAADKGKVRAAPTTPGIYFSPGVAENGASDGEQIICRPQPKIYRVGESHEVIAAGIRVWAGGVATTDALTITGVLATDVVVATLAAQGAAETLKLAITSTDTVTFTLSANGTNGSTKINYAVLRAL